MKRLLYLLSLLLLLTSCNNYSYTDSRFLMGTECTITVYEKKDVALLDKAFSLIEAIDGKLSLTKANSEVSEINANAGVGAVSVSEESYNLIKRAMELSNKTEGAFNPLIGSLTALWGIGSDHARVPSSEETTQLLPYTSKEHIHFDDSTFSIFLDDNRTQIDLGGIGKGYASDVVATYLKDNKVSKAIINLGGNVYVLGSKSDKESWVVGLQNPDSDYGGYYATVDVVDSAVITSGAYERFTVEDGQTYHHILDPKSGYPSSSNLLSASIISADATLADALSTAVFVLGEDEGSALIKKMGVRAVLLTKDMNIVRL